MAGEACSLVIDGAGASVLRRQLGPTTWVVLEQLVAHADGPVGVFVASVSVRSLAVELGVSKDTVARALGRLRDAGLVTAEQTRAASGTFAAGSYRIAVPACITFVTPDVFTVATTRPVPRASTAAAAQPSLFDRDPPTS